jgi:hypothetical protein
MRFFPGQTQSVEPFGPASGRSQLAGRTRRCAAESEPTKRREMNSVYRYGISTRSLRQSIVPRTFASARFVVTSGSRNTSFGSELTGNSSNSVEDSRTIRGVGGMRREATRLLMPSVRPPVHFAQRDLCALLLREPFQMVRRGTNRLQHSLAHWSLSIEAVGQRRGLRLEALVTKGSGTHRVSPIMDTELRWST